MRLSRSCLSASNSSASGGCCEGELYSSATDILALYIPVPYLPSSYSRQEAQQRALQHLPPLSWLTAHTTRKVRTRPRVNTNPTRLSCFTRLLHLVCAYIELEPAIDDSVDLTTVWPSVAVGSTHVRTCVYTSDIHPLMGAPYCAAAASNILWCNLDVNAGDDSPASMEPHAVARACVDIYTGTEAYMTTISSSMVPLWSV